jgi:hypothetical protein
VCCLGSGRVLEPGDVLVPLMYQLRTQMTAALPSRPEGIEGPRDEGSDAIAYGPWARDAGMRKDTYWGNGETGWEPGPDYYSTR